LRTSIAYPKILTARFDGGNARRQMLSLFVIACLQPEQLFISQHQNLPRRLPTCALGG
jgi:hypothetical protein